MNFVNQQILARLESYRDYSNFDMKKFVNSKPSGLNFKVIDSVIRIKLRRDMFIEVDGDDIYLVDTFIPNGDYVTKIDRQFIIAFKGLETGIGWIKKFIFNPDRIFKLLSSRLDPLIPCKMYIPTSETTKSYIRVNGKRANAIKASQIEEFRNEGVIIETGAKVDNTLNMRIGAKKKVHSFNNSKTDNSRTNLTQRFKRG